MTIIYAIIIFLILIFVHETGHLISAKLSGIRVNEFALGMGPKLLQFGKGETKYSLRAIPFGGYCALEGEDEESGDPRAFGNKPAHLRALVLFAGSLMNIALAVVLLSMVIFSEGDPARPTRTLAFVSENAPAYADGLQAGDELLSLNGMPINDWEALTSLISRIADENPENIPPLTLTVLREGAQKTITTRFFEEGGTLKIGVTPKFAKTPEFFFKSFAYGARATVSMSKMMYGTLGQLLSGRAGMDQLTGPVGIVVAVGDTAQYGFVYILQLTALISLNLGIVNLLPFPALDGGRLLFLLIRRLTGKAVTDKIEGRVHFVGIAVLFAFMALITVQDVGRIFLP